MKLQKLRKQADMYASRLERNRQQAMSEHPAGKGAKPNGDRVVTDPTGKRACYNIMKNGAGDGE